MELKEIIKEERREVDVDKIEMPSKQDENIKIENEPKEKPSAEVIKEIPVAQLATMAIGAYNSISCAIYRRFEPGFDASLTQDEVTALQQPTEQFLEQYNIKMTPTTALIIAIVGVNMVKVMQLRAYRAAQAQQNSNLTAYGEPATTTDGEKKENNDDI